MQGGERSGESWEFMSSWSSAVTNLASLASKGDRNGCLKIIPTLQPHEINTIIDPTNDLTFLHRACQLDEQLIALALLQHGADISIQNKHGETGWTIACKAGFISILNVMIPFLQPRIPNILSDLVGSILPESEIISILHLLIHDQQSDWASSNQECVHLCVFLERFEILRVLLQLGFEESLRIPNRHGLSPLQVAEVRLIWVCTSDEQREKLRYLDYHPE